MFLQVLHALVVSISQWFPVTNSTSCTKETDTTDGLETEVEDSSSEIITDCGLREIETFFKDYLRQRHITETLDSKETEMSIEENCIENDPKQDIEMETDAISAPPKYVIIVKQVCMSK